jgi:hypothetical protein
MNSVDRLLRNAAQALSEVRTLKGQDHSVVFTAPEALAPVLVEFFGAGKAARAGAAGASGDAVK